MNVKFFEQLGKLGEATVEMSFAAARSMVVQNGQGGEQELQKAGWKTYDAWVRLINEAANGVYGSPEIGASIGRSMESSLKWQRLGSAMTSAFFAALWPAMGLPTAAELTELRAEVGALRDDLAMARLEGEEGRAAEDSLVKDQAGDALTAMWNGGWIPAVPAAPFRVQRGKDAAAN